MPPSGKSADLPPPRRGRRINAGGAGRAALKRPKPDGCPDELARGTEPYRTWECQQILAMTSAGIGRAAILARLHMTRGEWNDRWEQIREETHGFAAQSGLAFARYAGSQALLRQELMRAMALARDGQWEDHRSKKTGKMRRVCVRRPSPVVVGQLVQRIADLDRALIDVAVRLGVTKPPAPDADAGRPAGPMPLSAHAQYLAELLRISTADLETLTPEEADAQFRLVSGELGALQHRPKRIVLPQLPSRG